MHEQRGVVVSLTCTKGNVALNLIESLRSIEAMGSVGNGSPVTCLALRDGSALACYQVGLLRLTRGSTIIGRLFLSARTPCLGVDADCGGVP